MVTKKEIASAFLLLCAEGKSRKAFGEYVSPGFKHHNAFFKGDADSLMLAIEENAKQNPNKIFKIQRALEDGDLVAVHSCVRMSNSHPAIAVMHIFRFENEKIVELWDFGQAEPEAMVNENGMF